MEELRRLPIGVQDFAQMRRDGYVYVDKTHHIYEMVRTGYAFFLSRPRRFGKSLLVSTLNEYFTGNKELFDGLYLGGKEKKWEKYPVFRFDFSAEDYNNPETYENVLNKKLSEYEEIYGTDANDFSLTSRFQTLLKRANERTGLKCVVLVDEYDKPLLDTINDTDLNTRIKTVFKSFFGVLKRDSMYVKFVFITGITKLRNVSIFSDLNNLNDISMDVRFSDICGITQTELENNFGVEIEDTAKANSITKEECLKELKKMYDGYHFSKKLLDVYNPFSVLNALYKTDVKTYWLGQATPSYLINTLQSGEYSLINYDEGYKVDSSLLDEMETSKYDPTTLLYQSGYLTIKGYDSMFKSYILSYPNDEIRTGFVKWLAPFYINKSKEEILTVAQKMVEAMTVCDLNVIFELLKSLYASLPYPEGEGDKEKMMEREYRNIASIIFSMVGCYVVCERHFSQGRADTIVQTNDYILIFEFKVDKSAKEALRQIDEKGYADAFKSDHRRIVKLGVDFSSKSRNIDEWVSSVL